MLNLNRAEHNAFSNAQKDVYDLIKNLPDVQKEDAKLFIEQLINLGINLMKEQVNIQIYCENEN